MRIPVFLLLPLFTFSLPQIFVDYSDISNEGILISKFFYGIDDGYFVDVGAYDPYFHSNTVNLEALGWDGIHVDAGPNRLVRFLYTKPYENSINAAIGQQNQFAVLYDLQDDSSSTISKKVLDYNLESMSLIRSYYVPSLTFKQFCERYYLRRPLFMNLDIEGFGYKALQSNDWSNPKCVPDIIISQNNIVTQRSGFPQQDKILIPNGYIKWKDRLGMNQLFIHSSVYDHYIKKYNEANAIFQKIQVVRFDTGIQIPYGLKQNVWAHYQMTKDKYYYHVVRNDQIVDLQKINQYSNLISENYKNRPILLMNYNPNKSFIALRKDFSYKLSQTPSMNNAFFNLTITMGNGEQFSVLIYDHKHRIGARYILLQQEKQIRKELKEAIEKKGYNEKMEQSLVMVNEYLYGLIGEKKELGKEFRETERKILSIEQGAQHQNILLDIENKLKKQAIKQTFVFMCLFLGMLILNICLCKLKKNTFEKYVKVQRKNQSNIQLDEFSGHENRESNDS